MAGVCMLFARLLIVSVFILAGINKFQEPQGIIVMTKGSIDNTQYFLKEQHKIMDLPLKDLMKENAESIVYAVAVVEIVGGLLVLAGSKFASFVLFSMLVGFTAMVHNPFLDKLKEGEKLFQWKMTFYNTLIMLSLLMIIGYNGKRAVARK